MAPIAPGATRLAARSAAGHPPARRVRAADAGVRIAPPDEDSPADSASQPPHSSDPAADDADSDEEILLTDVEANWPTYFTERPNDDVPTADGATLNVDGMFGVGEQKRITL